MATYTIVETVCYEVEALSAEDALKAFLASGDPYGEFEGSITNRIIEDTEGNIVNCADMGLDN